MVDEPNKTMDANNNETVLRRTESEVSKSEISIQLVEEDTQRESPAECEREQKNNGEHFTERELLEPQAYKGNSAKSREMTNHVIVKKCRGS